MNSKTLALLMLVTTAVVLIIGVLLAERIPLSALTTTRMGLIEDRIRHFYANEHRLPADLAALPRSTDESRDSSLNDGWGQPIQYRTRGRHVRLTSFGEDGHPGGVGQNADITVTFTVSECGSSQRTGN